jgi:hypothetical protein
VSTPPPPAPPSTSLPRPNRKRLYLGAAVAVAIAVLLVGVFVLTKSGGACSGGGAVLPYSGARPVADCTAGGFQGGGWTLLFAAGVVSATTEVVPENTTALGNLTSGCTYTTVAKIGNITLPGYSGNRSSGDSPVWEFVYRNSSNTLAVVSVIDGQGTVLATLSGLECAFYAQLFTPVPGNVIDSSQAAADVQPKAAAFLAAHPTASAVYGLVGGVSFLGRTTGPEWSILYNTCPLSPTASGTGVEFNATVNALTGQVTSTNTTSGVSCGSATGTTTLLVSSPTVGSLTVPSSPQRPIDPA